MPGRPAAAPLVLAAGASSRMGRPKAALPFGPRTALGLILDACAALDLSPPVVVGGAHVEAVRAAAAGHPRARVVANPRWASGRTTSIQVGLEALAADEGPFLLWPVDVCLPGVDVVAALLDARRRRPDAAGWVPSHGRRRGHPVLLDRAVASRLLALAPEEPARTVIRALHAEGLLEHVEVDDPAVLWDMDTPEDYARLLAEHEARRRR